MTRYINLVTLCAAFAIPGGSAQAGTGFPEYVEADALATCRTMADQDRNYGGSFLEYMQTCMRYQGLAYRSTKENMATAYQVNEEHAKTELELCEGPLLWLDTVDCSRDVEDGMRLLLLVDFAAKYGESGFDRSLDCNGIEELTEFSACLDQQLIKYPPEDEPTLAEIAEGLLKREEAERAAKD